MSNIDKMQIITEFLVQYNEKEVIKVSFTN